MSGYLEPRAMREEWGTPASVFDPLHAEFGFTLDAAALPENAKCAAYFTPSDDGLSEPWNVTHERGCAEVREYYAENLPERGVHCICERSREVVWLNPPYGYLNLARWMAKAHRESQRGATVVCLVPAHTGQPWWHEWVIGKASEIRWIRGKVRFLRPDGSRGSAAPFPSCVVIYRPSTLLPPQTDGL